MNAETIKAIQDALAPVAAKIGEGASYGWEVVVKQQFISGVVDLIWAGLCLSVLVAAIAFSWKARKWIMEETDGGLFAFTGFIGVMSAVFFMLTLTEGVQYLLNPDYYALQFFMDLVKH